MLVNYSQAWSLPWSVVDITNDTRLEKAEFYFASGYQLQVASWLGVGILCPLSLLSDGILSG